MKNMYDIEKIVVAEEIVLGSILIDPHLILTAVRQLTMQDFFLELHAEAFQKIVLVYKKNQVFDVDLLLLECNKKTESRLIKFFWRVVKNVTSPFAFEAYIKIIKEYSHRRKIYNCAKEMISYIDSNENIPLNQLLDKAEKAFFQIFNQDRFRILSLSVFLPSIINDLIEDKKKDIGILTGYKYLDTILTGYKKSEITVIAARPGVGKTAFAITHAINAAIKEKKRILFFSLEMSSKQITKRFISFLTNSDISSLLNRALTNIEKDNLKTVLEQNQDLFKDLNIFLIDQPLIDFFDIKNLCRSIVFKEKIDIVFIDYLQLMRISVFARRRENRHEELSRICTSLKNLSLELDIPFVLLSQLNRSTFFTKEPSLYNLKSSSAIEESADNVLLLQTLGEEETNEQKQSKVILVKVAKHRNGPLGKVVMKFTGALNKFEEEKIEKNDMVNY